MIFGFQRRQWSKLGVAALFVCVAPYAEAHAVFSTKGPFIGGLKHFAFSLEDVLAAIAVGIVAAQSGNKVTGRAVAAVAAGWFVAGVLGLAIASPVGNADAYAASSLLLLGIVGALDRRLPDWLVISGAALFGAMHGLLNGLVMQPETWRFGLIQLGGITVAALFAALYPATMFDLMKPAWSKILARVMASWIAAAGLLMLGWTFRAHH